MNIEISNEADVLICLIYKEYKNRRKNNFSKTQAKIFGSSKDIQETILPKWSLADVDDTCRELDKVNFLNCFYADDIAYVIELTDSGIVYMENRFVNGVDEILDYLGKFRNLLPF